MTLRLDEFFASANALPVADLDQIFGTGGIVVVAPHPDDETLGCGGLIQLADRHDGGLSGVNTHLGEDGHEHLAEGFEASSRMPHRNIWLSRVSLAYTLQLAWSGGMGLCFIQPPQTYW